MVWVANFFKANEFDCACCGIGGDEMDPRLLIVADGVREKLGPMVVNSGYRCPSYNDAVGGAVNSYHPKHMAADFTYARRADRTPINILRLRITFEEIGRRHLQGFGIGLYNTFCHFDCRESHGRWSEFDYPRN